MLDLRPTQLEIVRRILAGIVPDKTVWAFGSRVEGGAKDHSDLDLAIVSDTALSIDEIGRLREAFAESDIPFRVDIVDTFSVSGKLKDRIQTVHEVVRNGSGEE
jgi:type I restriction enzyme S subunit